MSDLSEVIDGLGKSFEKFKEHHQKEAAEIRGIVEELEKRQAVPVRQQEALRIAP